MKELALLHMIVRQVPATKSCKVVCGSLSEASLSDFVVIGPHLITIALRLFIYLPKSNIVGETPDPHFFPLER